MRKVSFKVNGLAKQVIADQDMVLLDLLREQFGLTGVKQSCDRKGQCGACTVIVNKQAVLSCLTKVASLEGAEVITIEGLGTPDNPHLIQEAFALAGAIQCGFCTPGMIMAAKALLDRNPNPSRDEIKEALRRNLCRCTGYKKIIEAVELAGRFLRGESSPDQVRAGLDYTKLGSSLVRPSALAKACGTAAFTADIHIDGMLELAVVRSPHHHALIKSIDMTEALAMPGVVGGFTAADIKGTNRLKMVVADQPVLCDAKAHVLGAPVAAIAARTRHEALEAVKAVKVQYEELPRLTTTAEALAEGAIRVHDDTPNLCFTQKLVKGDVKSAWKESAEVVEASFQTQCVHQAPLEPEVSVAYLEPDEDEPQLVVIGRGINIHHHLALLQEALGCDNMRYEEAYTGGQFGIKLDITAEALAAAAALLFRRPVRYQCSLEESMWITTKRHPLDMKLKLGADQNGLLTGYEFDYTITNGAYTSLGWAVLLRVIQMLTGSYNIPNVKAEGRLVYTNDAWGGAARGAGPPQSNFALESAMDMLAEKLNLDPVEFRIKNALRPGQSTGTGQVVKEWPYPGCLEVIKPIYEKAKREAESFDHPTLRRGVGLAGASFGIGKTTPGDKSTVFVELDPDGGLGIYGSVADPGEGNDIMLTQIASHLTGIRPEKIRLHTRSTAVTPDSGSAAGSRQTYMSGGALVSAIEQLQKSMNDANVSTYEELKKAGQPTRYTGIKTQGTTPLDPETGQGLPYETQVHGIQMAEVEVDTESGQVRVLKMTAVVDPGVIINRQAVEGQIEGGLDMGVGMALREEYVHGRTKDWVTFKFPTIKTAFDIHVITRETPRKTGTLGATGVGEFVLLPTSAAVMNAIHHAAGVRITRLPATPERVKEALAGLKD